MLTRIGRGAAEGSDYHDRGSYGSSSTQIGAFATDRLGEAGNWPPPSKNLATAYPSHRCSSYTRPKLSTQRTTADVRPLLS